MAEGFKRLKKEIRSLSFRLPMIFAMSGLVIMLIVVPIVYYWFRDRMIDDYSRMAQGMARMMAQTLDADGIDAYLENDQQTEKYLEIRQRLMDIKKYYPDVIYAFVLRFERDGAVVVFNPQETGEWTGDGLGDFRTLDATYSKYQKVQETALLRSPWTSQELSAHMRLSLGLVRSALLLSVHCRIRLC